MNELTPREKKILLCAWVLSACVYAQKCLEQNGVIGFGDIVFFTLFSCFWLWVCLRPSSSKKQRYEVVVVNQPDNNPIHLIERR